MATRQKFSNNGTSTLLGAFAIGATSLSVQAGHGARYASLAATEHFMFTIKDAAGNIEICKCTTRTVDTFNVVVRAQEGTTERNWLAGDLVEARITRDTMDRFPQKDADETISGIWSFTNGVPFPVGTRMLFQQTAAPTGWTKETNAAYNDKALRFVTGTVGSGGTTAFSSVFGAGKTTGSHALTAAQIPNLSFADGWTGVVGNYQRAGSDNGPNTNGTVNVNTGGGGGHIHTLSLDLQYVDLIIATKN